MRPLLIGTLVLIVLAAFVATRFEVSTDITHFLPAGEADPDVLLARQLASGELSRTMVLLVQAPDTETAVRASRDLEAALRAEPRVGPQLAFLDAGPPAGIEATLWKLYQPRRLAFLADRAEDVPSHLTSDALHDAATRLKDRLALPISGLVSRVAPGDPLLIFPRLLQRLSGSRGESLAVVDGRFVTEDGTAAVLFLATRAAAFDSTVQAPLLAGVQEAFDGVDARHGGALELLQSGANRFAVRAEHAIRTDIQRVSIGSVVGIVLLLGGLFGSLRLVLLAMPVLAAGFLAGTAACLLLFGRVHGLTLAFGSALIGVSIDYAVHFHCHQVLAADPRGPRRTLSGIWNGLWLGAATTVVGFVALLVSSFPGLRELALFGACGIAAALFATRAFLPALVGERSHPPRSSLAVARAIGTGLRALQRRPVVAGVPTLAMAVVAALGLPQVRWNDDIADLGRLDPVLLREDTAVRDRVVRYEQRRLVLAKGSDEQAALQVNDRVARALAAATEAGELGGWRSAASLLPAAAHQRAIEAAVRADATLWPRMRDALVAAGFVADAFGPFRTLLESPPPEPIVPADLEDTPLEPLVRPFRVSLDDGVGMVSFLHDVRDADALAARLQAIDGARLLDIGAILTDAYGAYRDRMTRLLLLGLLAVVGLVALRHRAVRPTVMACAPALLGAAATVAVLALAGVAMNVLTLVALLMVVSMGVDYGVFLAEADAEATAAVDATQLAVVVAAASTMLGFGLLALSDHPALYSIGSTSAVGVSSCLLLALTMRVLLARPGSRA